MFTRPSVKNLDEFVLGVEVENLTTSFPIVIRQITSIGHSWKVSFLGHEYVYFFDWF
jgi:hypothetical protein